ncbi:hypothetical protein BKI52_17460 [marine bacterium AO1-C]|nr:hypothetical protein BKI52_17460 [marine bacterium AO1-C]
MKRNFWATFVLTLLLACGQLQAQTLKIDAYTKCQVALIEKSEIGKDPYGWWSIWHKKKKNNDYKSTPCTFKGLAPGIYTVVVYNPAASAGNDKSDGVILKEIVVGKKFNLKAYYEKSDFKDWNCLSCPWLYIYNGQCFKKQTEVLKDVVGRANKTTTSFIIDPKTIIDGQLRIKIQEEKDEITHLDQLQVRINGKVYLPNKQGELLNQNDDQYLKLKKGESIEVSFNLPKNLQASDKIVLESTGFYIPDAQFLEAVYQKYLMTDK